MNQQADALEITVSDARTRFGRGEVTADVPVGVATLARELRGDPPRPEELTNAIGLVVDHVDDLLRERPELAGARAVRLHGPAVTAVAAVELGTDAVPDLFLLERTAAEDVFRTLATESARDRRHNPGLAPELTDSIVAACCIVVAIIRALGLDGVDVVAGDPRIAGQVT